MLRDGRVVGYPYRYSTLHDLYISDRGVVFCDSFGAREPGNGGRIYVAGVELDPEYFRGSWRTIRGVAGPWTVRLAGYVF